MESRRHFLKMGLAAAGAAMVGEVTAITPSAKPKKAFGLQLYTLRAEMALDPKETLRKVASYGYKQIESFEGPQGIFWGMGNKGFKTFVEDLGMKVVSSHCNINSDFERKATEAGEIGMQYLVCPAIGAQPTLDDYRKAADTFNNRGETCKKAGLRFAYHNHEYTFKPVDGVLPQDVLMQHTNAATVDFEMDIYWVVTAGHNPLEWMKKHPGRFKMFHIKDRKKDANPATRAAFTTLGDGQIDLLNIMKQAQKKENPYFFVEQDQADVSPLQAVQKNGLYLQQHIMPKL